MDDRRASPSPLSGCGFPADTCRMPDHPTPDDGGFTLIELVVVMSIAFVVLGGSLYLAARSFKSTNSVESFATSTDNVQRGIDELTHDLAHATSATVTATTATLTVPNPDPSLAAVTPTPTMTVVWTCTAGSSCTRKVGTGTARAEIPGVVSATLTPTYTTGAAANTPSYVGLSIQTRVVSVQNGANGATPSDTPGLQVYTGGTALRNFAR